MLPRLLDDHSKLRNISDPTPIGSDAPSPVPVPHPADKAKVTRVEVTRVEVTRKWPVRSVAHHRGSAPAAIDERGPPSLRPTAHGNSPRTMSPRTS